MSKICPQLYGATMFDVNSAHLLLLPLCVPPLWGFRAAPGQPPQLVVNFLEFVCRFSKPCPAFYSQRTQHSKQQGLGQKFHHDQLDPHDLGSSCVP